MKFNWMDRLIGMGPTPEVAELEAQALEVYTRAYQEVPYFARPLGSLALVFALPDTSPNVQDGEHMGYLSMKLDSKRADFTIGYDDVSELSAKDISVDYQLRLAPNDWHNARLDQLTNGFRDRSHRVSIQSFLRAAEVHLDGHELARSGGVVRANRKKGSEGLVVCETGNPKDPLAHSWHLPNPAINLPLTGEEPLRYLDVVRSMLVHRHNSGTGHMSDLEWAQLGERISTIDNMITTRLNQDFSRGD